MRPHTWFLLLALALALAFAVRWSPMARAGEPSAVEKLSALIDSRLAAGWAEAGVRRASPVDDATFLRRASLDLIGRIPTVAEAREFLSAPDDPPGKRAALIKRLVESGGHTRHMATFWRRTWLPQADTSEFARLSDDFEAWTALRMREAAPYDRVVRELLTLDEADSARPGLVSPSGFFAASEHKPENLAANATRVFLGVNLDCAQCHNHPFARWTRNQFWQTAAFFAPAGDGDSGPPRLKIPNSEKSLAPALLDGSTVRWPESPSPPRGTGRRLLANWMVAKDNPYFARNAVNRLWAHLYGRALVEPLDDLSGEGSNLGDHAELLEELADAFAASGYDLKSLTLALALTEAYQSSAANPDEGPTEGRLFNGMAIRGLTGEQLYDSLRTAAGLPPERDDTGRGQGREDRKRFAAQFHVERPVDAERSITQALSMMNGRLTTDLGDPANNPTLAGVVEAPFLDTAGKIDTLFLAVLGRRPREEESKVSIAYVEEGGTALGDLFWALVNTTEFSTNH